jgi:protein TonB
MDSAPYPLSSHPDRGALRRRATALVLALAANALLVLALLTLAPALTGKPEANRKPTTFSLLPEAAEEDDASGESAAKAERARDAVARPAPAHTPEVPAPAASPVPPPPVRLNVLNLSRDDLAATDRVLQNARRTDSAPEGSGTAGDASASAMAEGGGTGPNGERLYNAEWYVRPTRAELAFYLPAGGPRTGWGMIACRTVEKYRVEDCVELGQSPPGSGFARAVLRAAWQFRVIPPWVGPKRMVGAWVRIRIEYTESEVK